MNEIVFFGSVILVAVVLSAILMFCCHQVNKKRFQKIFGVFPWPNLFSQDERDLLVATKLISLKAEMNLASEEVGTCKKELEALGKNTPEMVVAFVKKQKELEAFRFKKRKAKKSFKKACTVANELRFGMVVDAIGWE